MGRLPYVLGRVSHNGQQAIVEGDEAHHLRSVLRARRGDRVVVFNGRGEGWEVELVTISPTLVEGRVLRPLTVPPPPVRLTVGIGIIKGSRMDWIVEKCGELGVGRLVPLITTFCVVEPKGNKERRWQNIALSAAKQSQNLMVMEVSSPISLKELLQDRLPNEHLWALDLSPHHPFLVNKASDVARLRDPQTPSPITLLVGPEGGWSDEERAMIQAVGGDFFQMGPHPLRTETATVVAVGMIMSFGWIKRG